MRLRRRTLLILGVLVALVPHVGIPTSWKEVLLTVFGIVIIGVAYFLNRSMVPHMPMKAQDLHPLDTDEPHHEN